MFQIFQKNRMWEKRPLKDRYEVVIIGGGVHGLSTAYYLGKLGVKDVAVLDKGYLGGGASARTTAIIRATPTPLSTDCGCAPSLTGSWA